MDGITALALTVNVIQVVLWGRQVIGVLKGGEIYQTQRDAATEFQSATSSLQKQLSLQPQSISTEDDSLLRIAQKCETTAVNLLKELGPIDDANRLKLAIKAPFKRPGIKKLEDELAFYQRVLDTELLVRMRKIIDLTALRMDQNFDNLSDGVQNLALKLEDGKTEMKQILDDHRKSMMQLENQSLNIVSTMRNLQLGVSTQRLAYDKSQFRQLLSSLSFSTIFSRRDQIAASYPETYKWALNSPQELEHDRHGMAKNPNLTEWLCKSDGLYWISGKAGSGKSTLMKFIVEDKRTETALSSWSGSAKLLVATHFFWSQGDELQQSQTGLLRSILYQILFACPALASFCGTEPHVSQHEWTRSRLVEALYTIALQSEVPLKLCLFVDGLDESARNPTELLDLLCKITSKGNIKCVISSRPWAVFHKRLSPYPQISLQELTSTDIQRFVSGTIQNISSPVPLSDGEVRKIIDSITGKAEGVFLWVSLATASILDGIGNGDDYDELQSRINELPIELQKLYGTTISHIEERYRAQAMRIFQLLLLKVPHQSLKPSVLYMSLVDLGERKQLPTASQNEGIDLDHVLEECNRTFLHLQQRCGGLLHLQSSGDILDSLFKDLYDEAVENDRSKFPQRLDSLEQAGSLQVQFLHRTVFDFFREHPEVLDISATGSSCPWDPLGARADAYVRMLEIKMQQAQGPSRLTNHKVALCHIPIVLLSIRCLELERCTAQRAMLERLDIQGRILLKLFGEKMNFAPEVHWCVLLSPRPMGLGKSVSFNSGSMTSLAELCAYSGLVHTAMSGLPQLSLDQCTASLHCTLNGLTYPKADFSQEQNVQVWRRVRAGVLTPSACIEDEKFAMSDFRARASLILEILQAGGCPNTGIVCVVRTLEHSDALSGPRRIHEKFETGETAWSHSLRMLTTQFYDLELDETHLFHNVDTVASWADLTQGFIDHHASPRQLVQNLRHIIAFNPLGVELGWATFSVTFDFESEPLPIIASYFQQDIRAEALLNSMRQKGAQSNVHFKEVQLYAASEFREIFTDIFAVDDISRVANGISWDTSTGVLDHLGARILSSNEPLWDSYDNDESPIGRISDFRFDPWDVALQKTPRPYTLEVLREVFIVLNTLEPRERMSRIIASKSRERDGQS